MDTELPRKLTAIFYADVAGYSRLTGLDELGTHQQLCFGLDVITERIQNTGGRVLHYAGDAVLADFESVIAATRCAIGIQDTIVASSTARPEDRRLLFRIGINLGDVLVDRGEIFGDGVNVAARLEQLAPPGGICVSDAVRQQIEGKLDVEFQDLGEQDFKNIERRIRVYQILREGSEIDTVSMETYQRFSGHSKVLGIASASPVPTRSDHVPDSSMPFQVIGINPLWRSKRAPESIMIMPFQCIGGSEEQRALVDGFRLSIQAVLVKLSGIFIVNAPVMEAFRGRELSATKAGAEAGIRYVLEGTVQIAGSRIRATVQLTDTPVGQVVWSEQYDRQWKDVFELQDEITGQIVTAVGIQFTESRGKLVWLDGLPEWQERQEILLAINHFYKGTLADNQLARDKFEDISRRHPDMGQGFALVAATHWRDLFMGWGDSPEKSFQHAIEYAEKAVALADTDGIGAMVLGYLRLYEHRFDEALSLSREGAVLRSSCPTANSLHATVLLYAGEPEAAIKSVRHAMRAQRGAVPWMANILAEAYRNLGEISRSIPIAEEVLQLDPRNSDTLDILCTDHGLAKSFDEARQTGQTLLSAEPDFSVSRYIDQKPYRDPKMLETIGNLLRDAGLD